MCNESDMTVLTNLPYDAKEEKSCLFNCEVDSDVTFVAGIDDDTWRIPGHKHVLTMKNQVFKAMLDGPLFSESVICIEDVDKRAFEQLLRFLYEDKVSLPSIPTARATLEAANKYLCPELVNECVKYLDSNLSPSTVLHVFQNLRFFCSRIPLPSNTPTAPSLNEINKPPGSMCPEEGMTERCNYLLHNCLLYIDEHADTVLQQECIEELSYEDIKIIAMRDTLNVTCEMELFHALNRWCKSECKRNKKELTPANRRLVLNELSYSVRYLLMTENEFIRGPQASEFLDLTECRFILSRMRKDKNIKLSKEQEEMLKKFETPRFYNVHVQPIHLSERSEKKFIPYDDKTKVKTVETKKKKNNKSNKKFIDVDKDEKNEGCSCSCFGEGLLRAFVCLFD